MLPMNVWYPINHKAPRFQTLKFERSVLKSTKIFLIIYYCTLKYSNVSSFWLLTLNDNSSFFYFISPFFFQNFSTHLLAGWSWSSHRTLRNKTVFSECLHVQNWAFILEGTAWIDTKILGLHFVSWHILYALCHNLKYKVIKSDMSH